MNYLTRSSYLVGQLERLSSALMKRLQFQEMPIFFSYSPDDSDLMPCEPVYEVITRRSRLVTPFFWYNVLIHERGSRLYANC
jgi:hypothetical protein